VAVRGSVWQCVSVRHVWLELSGIHVLGTVSCKTVPPAFTLVLHLVLYLVHIALIYAKSPTEIYKEKRQRNVVCHSTPTNGPRYSQISRDKACCEYGFQVNGIGESLDLLELHLDLLWPHLPVDTLQGFSVEI